MYYKPPYIREKKPFNRTIIKIVNEWEKINNIKFHGKIFSIWQFTKLHPLWINLPPAFFTCEDKYIYLTYSDKLSLLHELEHYKQQGNGVNVIRNSGRWYNKFLPLSYYKKPMESDANINALKNFKKIVNNEK